MAPSQYPGPSSAKPAAPLSSIAIATRRLKQELVRLQQDPPPGIAAYLSIDADNLSQWTAEVTGPVDSPFEGTVFTISMAIPARYPMEPPVCTFVTPIPYHPNICQAGRICLDTLKRPPTGSWSPASNLTTVLLSLQSLLQEPNPDDGLMADISRLYHQDRQAWWDEAKRRLTVTRSISSSSKENDIKRIVQGESADTTAGQDKKRLKTV